MIVVAQSIENDNLQSFLSAKLTRSDIENLRFEYNMNLLQYICNEEAVNILRHLTWNLESDHDLKRAMAQHKDSHLGSQAIHLASATGNHTVLQLLIT